MKRTLVLAIFSIALALPLFAQEMSTSAKGGLANGGNLLARCEGIR